MYMYTRTYTHMHIHSHAYTLTCTHTHVHAHAHIHAHTHTHTHTHTCTCTYTCTHTHTHTHTCTHTHSHTHTQNAPSRFQVVLVATDTGIEDVEIKLDIARQFAKEKQIPLMECNVEDLTSVEQTFATVVDRIMSTWNDGSSIIGQWPRFISQNYVIVQSKINFRFVISNVAIYKKF